MEQEQIAERQIEVSHRGKKITGYVLVSFDANGKPLIPHESVENLAFKLGYSSRVCNVRLLAA